MSALDASVGAFMVGTSGITMTQAFTYYMTFPDDKRAFWWLVTFVAVLDAVHSVISCYTVYFWGVTSFGNVAALARVPWSFAVEPAITGIVASSVQFSYAYRVYIVGGRKPYIPIAILVLSMVQFGFAVAATFKVFALNSEAARFIEWKYGLATWLSAASAADLLVTGSLVYYLRQVTEKQTKSIVSIILRNTIETNGMTSLFAVVNVFLFCFVGGAWHVIPQLSLSKLYCTACPPPSPSHRLTPLPSPVNSLLVSLNARHKIAGQLNAQATSQEYHQKVSQIHGNGRAQQYPGSDRVIVTITKETLDERMREEKDTPTYDRNSRQGEHYELESVRRGQGPRNW